MTSCNDGDDVWHARQLGFSPAELRKQMQTHVLCTFPSVLDACSLSHHSLWGGFAGPPAAAIKSTQVARVYLYKTPCLILTSWAKLGWSAEARVALRFSATSVAL